MPLPEPDADARQHSERLVARLRRAIDAGGGWLSFECYMAMALYEPGLGYYSAGARKLGADGDFVTAPEISPMFARALAAQVGQVLAECGGDVLELGAGSGRLAVDLLRELEAIGQVPARYAILEVSPELRARQRALFEVEAPAWLARVAWLDVLPERHRGVILGNEVLDALPVRLVAWGEGGVAEHGVAEVDGEFTWADRALGDAELAAAAHALPTQAPGYVSEVNLAAAGLVRALGDCLERGLALLIDYGFPRAEYYHPQRVSGTLMCHYRHHAHPDPFFLPGLQDITAHVDFSAVADAALEAGLDVLGYIDQARFLVNCGLLDALAGLDPDSVAYARQVGAMQKLIQPTEMGELFKVIALGRGLDTGLLGFVRGDRRHAL
jgi:SAM-dependent MidA family methyltransferase